MVRKLSYLVKISSFFVHCHLERYFPCLMNLNLQPKAHQNEVRVCFLYRQNNTSDMQHSFLHNMDMSRPMELKNKKNINTVCTYLLSRYALSERKFNVRGHSTTTWTKFDHVSLLVDKRRHFSKKGDTLFLNYDLAIPTCATKFQNISFSLNVCLGVSMVKNKTKNHLWFHGCHQ